jgi:adenylosuccinate lyase
MRGYTVSAMENIVLWDERDMSNSITERFLMNDMIQLFYYIVKRFTSIIDGLIVNKSQIRSNIDKTNELLKSQDILKILINVGNFSRTEAYDIIKECSETTKTTLTPLIQTVVFKVCTGDNARDDLKNCLEGLRCKRDCVPYKKLFENFELKYKTYIE